MSKNSAAVGRPQIVDADCGRGIEKLWTADFPDTKALWDYLKDPQKPFGIAEEVLTQHPDMAALHPQSVNCVRIATFVKDDGTPTVIYAACKAGSGDEHRPRGGDADVPAHIAEPGIAQGGLQGQGLALRRHGDAEAPEGDARVRVGGIFLQLLGVAVGNNGAAVDVQPAGDAAAARREGLIPRFTEQGIGI